VNGLPQLVSLDIGGTNLAGRGVAERPVDTNIEDTNFGQLSDIPGLASRINKPLQFLGLYGTAYGACRRHDIPAKVVRYTRCIIICDPSLIIFTDYLLFLNKEQIKF